MPYYLGIDGGGTKTTCAVGDEFRLIATAVGGPSNIVRVGEERARESLHHAVRQACAAAGVAPAEIAYACVVGSGAGRPEFAERVRLLLSEIVRAPVSVVGDMEIALEAAFGAGPGVIVIAGTGSIAFGRNPQGRSARAGGWGFAIGDEGSAHWIGREAVRAALRAADLSGTSGTSSQENFTAELCQTWKLDSVEELARTANQIPPPDFASLFPVVVASSDELAGSLLNRAGGELAALANIVIGRLFREQNQREQSRRVAVAMIGGVFRYSSIVREVFYNELRRLEPPTDLNQQVVEPIEGALRLARRSGSK